jgi:hypothetical protein
VTFNLREDLRVGAQIFVGDLGDYGNYEPRLDWGYVDWRPKNWLGIRGGKFKRPNGLYNDTLDVDAARTFILLPQSVYNLNYRDFFLSTAGVGSYGNIELGSGGDIDYQVYGGLPDTDSSSASSGAERMGSGSLFTTQDQNRIFSPGFSVVWNSPVDSLRTSMTMTPLYLDTVLAINPLMQMMGLPPTTDVTMRMQKWVVSAEYTTGQFLFAGEYSWGTGGISSRFFSYDSADEKYYLMGTYRINDLFEVGSYYSVNYEDGSDKAGEGFEPFYNAFQKDWTLTLRVDPVRYLIFKLEYHNVDGTGLLTQALNPEGTEKDWSYFTSKITFAF